MGRGQKQFYEVGSNLINLPAYLVDEYFEKAKNLNVYNK